MPIGEMERLKATLDEEEAKEGDRGYRKLGMPNAVSTLGATNAIQPSNECQCVLLPFP